MGIKSNVDLSGTVVNGVTLGIPALTENGEFHWDGGVPAGDVSDDGNFTHDDETGTTVPVTDLGVVNFPAWVQPTGAQDAYGDKVVVEDDGVLWVSLIPANVWKPGVSGWRRFSEDPNAIQPWVQPTGAHDAYRLGAKVTYNGFTWENTGSDANVWAPGVFGWIVI